MAPERSKHGEEEASTGGETPGTADGTTMEEGVPVVDIVDPPKHLAEETPGTATMEDGVPQSTGMMARQSSTISVVDVVDRRKQLAEAGLSLRGTEEHHSARKGFAVPSTADEIEDAKIRWGADAWQMKALQFINSEGVQRFLIALLIMDVIILFCELAIDAFVPSCKFVVRDAISCCPSSYGGAEAAYAENEPHRFLAGGGGDICAYPLEETDHQAGCDYNKHHGVHVAHNVLFWMTVAILGTFEVELLFLVYLIGPKIFCRQIPYMVDLIVVTLSLVLELLFRYAGEEVMSALPGILIVFRLWRFVRIGHGLVQSTYEVQERKIHLAVDYIEELEEKVKKYEEDAIRRPKKLRKSAMHVMMHKHLSSSQTHGSQTSMPNLEDSDDQ